MDLAKATVAGVAAVALACASACGAPRPAVRGVCTVVARLAPRGQRRAQLEQLYARAPHQRLNIVAGDVMVCGCGGRQMTGGAEDRALAGGGEDRATTGGDERRALVGGDEGRGLIGGGEDRATTGGDEARALEGGGEPLACVQEPICDGYRVETSGARVRYYDGTRLREAEDACVPY